MQSQRKLLSHSIGRDFCRCVAIRLCQYSPNTKIPTNQEYTVADASITLNGTLKEKSRQKELCSKSGDDDLI